MVRDALRREGLAEEAVRQCEDRFGDALAAVLDARLGELVGQVVGTQYDLVVACRRTRGSTRSEDVPVADLEIVTILHPSVEVRLNAVRIASVVVDVNVSVVLLAVVAVVTGGEISGYRSGDVVVRRRPPTRRCWNGSAPVAPACCSRSTGTCRPTAPGRPGR